MTAPNPFTAAELDDIQRSAERQRSWASVVGPKTLLRLVAQARRAMELEARVAELENELTDLRHLLAKALLGESDG